MLVKAIFTKLSTDGGISAITSTRVYPIKLPQQPTLPALTYRIITEPQVHSMEGTFSQNARLQIDCWAETFLAAHELAEAVEDAMNDFSGTIGAEQVISSSVQVNKQDLFDPEVNDYRVSIDYSIWHTPV